MLDPKEISKRMRRHEAFWQEKEKGEGAYIAIYAPADEIPPAPASPLELERQWFDLDYRLKQFNHALEATYCAGDAVPVVFADFGCGNLAGQVGAPYRLAEGTIWFDIDPPIKDWEKLPDLQLQENAPLSHTILAATEALAREAKGRYAVGITDIGANLDILVSLRKREDLLTDLIENPGQVQAMLSKINRWWRTLFLRYYEVITAHGTQISSFSPIVSRKKWYKLMSETSVMISPVMFEAFVLPTLAWQVDFLDHAVFNLDGEAQVKLLPAILDLAGLHAVEWNPVPRFQPVAGEFRKDFTTPISLDVCQRIQASGKKLILNKIRPADAEFILRHIEPDGVFFLVHCATKKEADDFAVYARRWQRH